MEKKSWIAGNFEGRDNRIVFRDKRDTEEDVGVSSK